jgi:Fe-S-cluster-containing hydrogenase component 2
MPEKKSSVVDIFGMLSEREEKEEDAKRKQREELLAATGVREFFAEGKISVDKRTCWGLECKLCVEACPTNALYWRSGEVGVVDELCVYCGACVLCCMVDDCIRVERRREDGRMERFSRSKDVVKVQEKVNARKRRERVSEIFPTAERYCERYGHGR